MGAESTIGIVLACHEYGQSPCTGRIISANRGFTSQSFSATKTRRGSTGTEAASVTQLGYEPIES